jgi:aminopeptidase YwaD
MAHIDAKIGTPGATDNAGGIIVLLLLAELLADYDGDPGIEIVAINGEDYFSNPGEQQYLALNAGKFNQIVLGINIDGVGYHKGRVAYSLYDCPTKTAGLIENVFSRYNDLVVGEPWYQGDHGLFLMNEVPALALTSEYAAELVAAITHTPEDCPEIINPSRLVTVAIALHDVLLHLEQHMLQMKI